MGGLEGTGGEDGRGGGSRCRGAEDEGCSCFEGGGGVTFCEDRGREGNLLVFLAWEMCFLRETDYNNVWPVVVRGKKDVCELKEDSVRGLDDEAKDDGMAALNKCEVCRGEPVSGSVSRPWDIRVLNTAPLDVRDMSNPGMPLSQRAAQGLEWITDDACFPICWHDYRSQEDYEIRFLQSPDLR